MSENSHLRLLGDQFDDMVSEFSRLIREGKSPEIAEFASRNEALAPRIRRLFPVLEMMETRGESWSWSEIDMCNSDEKRLKESRENWDAPQRLGDFRMIRQIGRGGMGVVFEAEQESLGRRVAIKILPASAHFDERRTERFATEAKASAMLHHTNIVPVFGIGQEDGLSFFVMQFINGQPLSHVLRDIAKVKDLSTRRMDREDATFSNQEIVRSMFGDSSESSAPTAGVNRPHAQDTGNLETVSAGSSSSGSERLLQPGEGEPTGNRVRSYFRNAARIGVKVSEALEHAHSHGILHRDIKPSNLLLDDQGSVWVTDFGLAKCFDSPDITLPGEVIGTLRYMSPEQLDGTATPHSDIFGLGLTLYEMLTLQPAYPGIDRKRLLEKVTLANPANPRSIDSRIPRDLETIVMKCIQSEPAKRYATAGEVGEDLNRFLVGEPIQARRIGLLEKSWKWCCRRPTLAVSFAALLMSILLGIAGVTWQWRNAEFALTASQSNLEKANVATGQAKEATQNANQNYTLARSAVVQLTESISSEELLTSPHLLPVRRKLLLKALDYQVRFVKNRPDDIDIKFELAEAYVNLALVCSELNRTEEAKQFLNDSRKLLNSLLERSRGEKQYKKAIVCLAETWALEGDIGMKMSPGNQFFLFKSVDVLLDGREEKELSDNELLKLAKLHWRVGDAYNLQNIARGRPIRSVTQLAKDRFMKAFKLIQAISAKDPANLSYARDIADLHRGLGSTNRRLKLKDEAFKHYSASVDQFRKLVELEPDNTDFLLGLCEALSSMAFYHDYTERDSETSLKYYTEALAGYRKLSEDYPSVLKFSIRESSVMMNCGLLLERSKKAKQAVAMRERAVQLCERSLLLAPGDPNLLSNHGKALMQMALNHVKRGEDERALQLYRQAVEKHIEAVKQAPLNPTYEIRLARTRGNWSYLFQKLGKFDSAYETITEAFDFEDPDPEVAFIVGRTLLRLARRIEINDEATENDLKIARTAIESAKAAFRTSVGPKSEVRERLERDRNLKAFLASDSGASFMGWLSDAQQRFVSKKEKLEKW